MATTATAELESHSPATGARLGAVPITAPEDVAGVVRDVASVQPFWAQLTLGDRARYLERVAQVVIDESDEIRDLISREQGKPRNEAFSMEVLPTIDALRWIGRAGQELLVDERIPMPQAFLKTKRAAFAYEPLGVIGVIAPWNYPWSIPFGEVAIALMAGNGVVLKPASATPADRGPDRPRVRAGGCARRPGAGRPRPRHRTGARRVRRGQGVLHRIGRGRPDRRRRVRQPPEGLGARARRKGPDDRPRRREPRARRRRCAVGRVRQRRPDLLRDRARVCRARGGRPLHRRGRRRRARPCGSAIRSAGTPRSGR